MLSHYPVTEYDVQEEFVVEPLHPISVALLYLVTTDLSTHKESELRKVVKGIVKKPSKKTVEEITAEIESIRRDFARFTIDDLTKDFFSCSVMLPLMGDAKVQARKMNFAKDKAKAAKAAKADSPKPSAGPREIDLTKFCVFRHDMDYKYNGVVFRSVSLGKACDVVFTREGFDPEVYPNIKKSVFKKLVYEYFGINDIPKKESTTKSDTQAVEVLDQMEEKIVPVTEQVQEPVVEPVAEPVTEQVTAQEPVTEEAKPKKRARSRTKKAAKEDTNTSDVTPTEPTFIEAIKVTGMVQRVIDYVTPYLKEMSPSNRTSFDEPFLKAKGSSLYVQNDNNHQLCVIDINEPSNLAINWFGHCHQYNTSITGEAEDEIARAITSLILSNIWRIEDTNNPFEDDWINFNAKYAGAPDEDLDNTTTDDDSNEPEPEPEPELLPVPVPVPAEAVESMPIPKSEQVICFISLQPSKPIEEWSDDEIIDAFEEQCSSIGDLSSLLQANHNWNTEVTIAGVQLELVYTYAGELDDEGTQFSVLIIFKKGTRTRDGEMIHFGNKLAKLPQAVRDLFRNQS